MADPVIAPVSAPPAEGYRPLSLLAVVGLGLGILSSGLYLFGAEWLVVLPLAGVLVSAIALYRIKHLDDALAGINVARTGLALSLVIGLSWATMQITSKLILQAEASRFADKWFECLRDGKEGLAFIATVSPRTRPPELKAEDLEPRHLRNKYPSPQGPHFDLFRSSTMPELLLRGGKDITWDRKGVEELKYEQGSYYVTHRYHIDTPELESDITIRTVSEQVDRPSGPRREWRIELNSANLLSAGMNSKAYGVELSRARQEAFRALAQWVNLIGFAKKDQAASVCVSDKDLTPEFERLYPAMRQGGIAPLMPVAIKGRQPLVLQAQQEGKRWTLTLRATIETGLRDVDFQTTWQNDELNGDLSRWRITDLKYLGDRKRIDTELRPPGPGQMRPPS